MENVIKMGIGLSYEERYQEAESCFMEVIKRYPEHPCGYFFLSGLLSLYITDLGKSELYDSLKMLVDTTVKKGERWIKKHPDDAWGYFFIGGAYTYLTFYNALKRKYINTLKYGLKALSKVSKAVEIDSTLYDAYLGLGGYDYFKGLFPFWRSQKEKGLRKIRLAMEKGRFSRELAADGLAQILIREKRYQDAKNILFSLLQLYPDSRTFRWPLLEIYMEEKNYQKAMEVLNEMERLSLHKENSPYISLSFAFFKGKILLHQRKKEMAKDVLLSALSIPAVTEDEKKVKKQIKSLLKKIKNAGEGT